MAADIPGMELAGVVEALGGPLTAWLGAQHVLLVSAAATVASGLVATTILITHRRKQTRPAAKSTALRAQA